MMNQTPMYGSYKKEHCWILYSSAHAPDFFHCRMIFLKKIYEFACQPLRQSTSMVALWMCQVPSMRFE
jgi:hypothetical protein